MIAKDEEAKMRKKYKQYQDMEEMSLAECHLRPFENNNDRFQNLEFDPPFMADPDDPDSARITGSQAKRLVHKYIDRIKVDRFTRLTPVWQTTYVQGTLQDNLFAGRKTHFALFVYEDYNLFSLRVGYFQWNWVPD